MEAVKKPRKYYRGLTFEDRMSFEKMLKDRIQMTVIADRLGVHRSTLYKELSRANMTRANYDARIAQNTVNAHLMERM